MTGSWRTSAAMTLAALLAPGASARDVVLDLDGYRLQQFVQVCERELGPPIQTRENDGYVMSAYHVDAESYLVAAHDQRHPNNISTLQLTGASSSAPPFKGLRLGDEEAKVLAALGPPTARIKAEDMDVTRLEYEGRNYSVEVDADGRLYSIRIVSTTDVVDETDDDPNLWRSFTETLRAKDFAAIAATLRPDVEIFKDGKTLSIQRRYADFLESPDPEFVAALIGDQRSVLEAIAGTEPKEELRIAEKLGVGRVFKFPATSPIEEIVFFPYAGKDRVYEISFRTPDRPLDSGVAPEATQAGTIAPCGSRNPSSPVHPSCPAATWPRRSTT